MLNIRPINFKQFMHISLSVRQKGFGFALNCIFLAHLYAEHSGNTQCQATVTPVARTGYTLGN